MLLAKSGDGLFLTNRALGNNSIKDILISQGSFGPTECGENMQLSKT
jgi:hypothetical protein